MKYKNLIRLFGIFIFTAILALVSNAQEVVTRKDLDSKSQKEYKKVGPLSREKKYDKALKKLDKILKKYPTFVDGYLKKSGLLYNMEDKEASIKSIDKAIAISPEYDAEMYFSKAIIHKELEQYEQAAFHFDMYVTRAAEGKRKEKAKVYFAQTSFADYALKNPVPYNPEKLVGDVNSSLSEYIPAITLDGAQMIFTRRQGGQEDLYISDLKDGVYQDVRPLEAVNTVRNEGVHTISADGGRIIFTACGRLKEGIGGCDLFTSRVVNGNWSIPQNLGPVINTPAWDAQPSLSADGKTLYWSSNRKYGRGGNDIWMSTRTDTSGWNPPVPLSESINTSYNEESPFIHPDGKTLYFRSDRPAGMGGFDIFYSRYNDTTRMWNPAVNMGYPINTQNSEGALSVSLNGKLAFFATDQETGKANGPKNLDIFTFELYDEARPQPVTFVKAIVTDAESGSPVSANIEIVNLSNDEDKQLARTNAKGTYINSLLARKTYAFFVSAPGYIFASEHIDLDSIKTVYDPIVVNIKLNKLPAKKVVVDVKIDKPQAEEVVLKNVFFETGSAQLTATSTAEIDRLVDILTKNKSYKMEIAGHTDNVGSKSDNLELSEQRAKAVVDALVMKGISAARLSYKGYGEEQPLDTNETIIGRQNNRRTTFKIL